MLLGFDMPNRDFMMSFICIVCLEELQFFRDVKDLRPCGRSETDGGYNGFTAEKVFAPGVHDSEHGNAGSRGSVLRTEQFEESQRCEANFGAGRGGKILMVCGQ